MNEAHELFVSEIVENQDYFDRISFLLVNNEEIELTIRDRKDILWITNKRLIVLFHAESIFSDDTENLYSFLYSAMTSFLIQTSTFRSPNSITIKVNGIKQLVIKLNYSLPIKEISQLLSSKTLI